MLLFDSHYLGWCTSVQIVWTYPCLSSKLCWFAHEHMNFERRVQQVEQTKCNSAKRASYFTQVKFQQLLNTSFFLTFLLLFFSSAPGCFFFFFLNSLLYGRIGQCHLCLINCLSILRTGVADVVMCPLRFKLSTGKMEPIFKKVVVMFYRIILQHY